MANEEQLAILRQGVEVWNEWRARNIHSNIDLKDGDLKGVDLPDVNLWRANCAGADFSHANLIGANLYKCILNNTNLQNAILSHANLSEAQLINADMRNATLFRAMLDKTDLRDAWLMESNLNEALVFETNLIGTHLVGSNFSLARISSAIFGYSDLSEIIGLESITHMGPSHISMNIFPLSKGKVSEVFLRGCGLNDADIEYAKLYNLDLGNDEKTQVLYKMYDLRASQAIQISPLFISYSHGDDKYVDKIERQLNKKGVRFWRDIHDMKAGRMEKQVDRAIRQNPTVLLVLSEYSLSSDWVEHEVRTARELEKELERDVLCPVALDDSWKSGHWPARVMEQIMEYNILDFSEWQDDVKFDSMFRKLIDGLELFYKG